MHIQNSSHENFEAIISAVDAMPTDSPTADRGRFTTLDILISLSFK